MLTDILNFKIVPSDKIIDAVMDVAPEDDGSGGMYSSANILKNIGVMVVFLLMFGVIILIVLALRKLLLKWER